MQFVNLITELHYFVLLTEAFIAPWSLNWKDLRSHLEFMFFLTIMRRSGEIYLIDSRLVFPY